MKISNEKTLIHYANTKPSDKEGYLLKRGEGKNSQKKNLRIKFYLRLGGHFLSIFTSTYSLFSVNKSFQKRFFTLKGNLLFYFDKKGGDLIGMIVLEGCSIELAENEQENYCFYINFIGNRRYVLATDNQEDMEGWMRALAQSGFDYMKIMVSEMQRQLEEFEKSSYPKSFEPQPSTSRQGDLPPVPPRRQNPFNKFNCKYFLLSKICELDNDLNNVFLDNTNSTAGVANDTITPTPPMRPQQIATSEQINVTNSVVLRRAPSPPIIATSSAKTNEFGNRDTVRFEFIRDDNELLIDVDESEEAKEEEFNFAKLHEIIGRPVLREIEEKRTSKAMQDQPLIMF